MKTALANASILVDGRFLNGHAVIIDGERIEAVVPAEQTPSECRVEDLGGALLLPGFIDVQVNGGGGRLFNDDPTVEAIRHIGAVHRRFGTTGFLPTLISDDLDKVETAIKAVDQAMENRVPGVLGIHLEGPFLSTDRKGVHDPSKFRQLAGEHIELLASLKSGVTLVTLSPESAAPTLIRTLVDRGVIVSAGHTNASYADMRRALDHGVTGFTHLFNAMSPITSREPGVVGAALEDQESWCGIIVDGQHVSPTTLSIALKTKPLAKFILVTDAMPSVGMRDKTFRLQGRTITAKNGVCIAEGGMLAGSDLDMARAVRNATEMLHLDLKDAVAMASANPAAFLGLDDTVGRIAPGYRANLIAVEKGLTVVRSWISGAPASPATENPAARSISYVGRF